MKILDKRGDYQLIDRDGNYIVKHHDRTELLTRSYELAIECFIQTTKEV